VDGTVGRTRILDRSITGTSSRDHGFLTTTVDDGPDLHTGQRRTRSETATVREAHPTMTSRKIKLAAVILVTIVAVGGAASVAHAAKAPSGPVITTQPTDATAKIGTSAHFTVTTSGNPKPAYQWEVSTDGVSWSDIGTSSHRLTVTATTANDGSTYRVTVSNPSGSVTSSTATLTIEVASDVARVKPRIAGLIDKGSQAPYDLGTAFPVTSTTELAGYGTAFSGIVVNVAWSQLEPAEGQFDLTPLAQSLAAVTAYDTQNPSDPLGVKLRIWAGFAAPDWAKSLDGTPITVAPGTSGASGTLGRFWAADYEQQWTDLQDALAKAYDKDPLVHEIAVTSCSTATGEPFVLTSNVIDALLAAGWTTADQQQCLSSALADYAAWHDTTVDYTFNVLSDVSSSGTRSPDIAFTDSVMSACASSELTGTAPLCSLDNHGLTDTITPQQQPVYGEIDTLWQQFGGHVPVEFQTIAPGGFDLCEAVGEAIGEHAASVEIWPAGTGFPGFSAYSPSQLTTWNTALVDQAPPAC